MTGSIDACLEFNSMAIFTDLLISLSGLVTAGAAFINSRLFFHLFFTSSNYYMLWELHRLKKTSADHQLYFYRSLRIEFLSSGCH